MDNGWLKTESWILYQYYKEHVVVYCTTTATTKTLVPSFDSRVDVLQLSMACYLLPSPRLPGILSEPPSTCGPVCIGNSTNHHVPEVHCQL